MILTLHTDGFYLSEHGGKSRVAAYMYLTKCDVPDFHNGTLLVLLAIIKYIMASASKSELVAKFYGCKEAIPLRTSLEEMRHPQYGPTPVTIDNSTAVGLTMKTMCPKHQKLWICASSGSNVIVHNNFSVFSGQKASSIELTTPANIICLLITSKCIPSKYKTRSQPSETSLFHIFLNHFHTFNGT